MVTKKAEKKTVPIIEMEIKTDNLDIVDGLINHFKKEYKTKWTTDTNFTYKTEVGTYNIKFPILDSETSETDKIVIETNATIKKELDALIKVLKLDVTDEEITKSVFVGNISNFKNEYMKLGKNVMVLRELSKFFSRYGIEQVGFSHTITEDPHNYCSDKMTIMFTPYNRNGQSTPFRSDFFNNYKNLGGYHTPNTDGEALNKVDKEEVDIIKVGEYEIGQYYKERNIILIWFNPLSNIDLKMVKSYTEIEWLNTILPEIMMKIVDLKIKKCSVENFSIRLLMDSFKKEQKKSLSKKQSSLRSTQTDLENYQQNIVSLYEKRVNLSNEIEALKTLDKGTFEKQISLLHKNPLLDKVELKEGAIFMTFKETSIKCKMDRSGGGDENKHGIREMYLGKVGFKITGGNKISVYSDHPITKGNAHPHSSSSGQPCFGEGEGKNKIFQLLGERKFNDLAPMLWMWIKTYRNKDAYERVHVWYDDRLAQGYPVFDHKGQRITLNDTGLIKTGEQRKQTKSGDYEKNQKATKDFKPQK